MSRFGSALVSCLLFLAFEVASMAQTPTASNAAVTLTSGTKLEVALVRPLWANAAAPGSQIYAQTTFPVVTGDRVIIPAGTYVEGTIEKLTRPTRRSNRAQIEVLFTQIVFANGYVVSLPAMGPAASAQDVAPSLIDVTVQVSPSNDLLLDNGAQIEITLASPLALDSAQTAAAPPLSRAPAPGQFKSASLCRPTAGTPGTPGSPDTVIPGTPATPDTVIPGGPGMPDTVIPGSPGTPDTVIPGTPGTPGFPGSICPAPPMVISNTPGNPNIPASGSPVQAPAPAAAH
jgi:hypothetical protein